MELLRIVVVVAGVGRPLGSEGLNRYWVCGVLDRHSKITELRLRFSYTSRATSVRVSSLSMTLATLATSRLVRRAGDHHGKP